MSSVVADDLDEELQSDLDEAAARRPSRMAGSPGTPRKGPGRKQRSAHKWTRLVHVYSSMVCFLVVLFFAVTGITLNHPSWVLGSGEKRTTVEGTMPADWKTGSTIDWLRVDEYLRSEHGITGHVDSHTADTLQAAITFKGPGYEADATIKVSDGTYQMTVDQQGLLAVMNDLHKGRDTNSSWKWLIDVVAGVLALISVSGLALQFFLRRRRTSGLITAVVGGAVVLVMIWLAVH